MRKLTAIGIARRNARWNAADDASKRTLLARDVIASVNAGRLEPVTGTYLDGPAIRGIRYGGMAALEGMACSACALGSMVVERFKHDNKTHDMLSVGQRGMHEALDGLFSPIQCSLIEAAFERRVVFYSRKLHPDGAELTMDDTSYDGLTLSETGFDKYPAWRDAVEFGKQYTNPEDRLKAIMDNIIANGGAFHPKVG